MLKRFNWEGQTSTVIRQRLITLQSDAHLYPPTCYNNTHPPFREPTQCLVFHWPTFPLLARGILRVLRRGLVGECFVLTFPIEITLSRVTFLESHDDCYFTTRNCAKDLTLWIQSISFGPCTCGPRVKRFDR